MSLVAPVSIFCPQAHKLKNGIVVGNYANNYANKCCQSFLRKKLEVRLSFFIDLETLREKRLVSKLVCPFYLPQTLIACWRTFQRSSMSACDWWFCGKEMSSMSELGVRM